MRLTSIIVTNTAVLLFYLVYCSNVFSQDIAGPSVIHERLFSTKINFDKTNRKEKKLQVPQNKTKINALIPIPLNVFEGQFVFKTNWSIENNYLSQENNNEAKHQQISYGMAYVRQNQDKTIKYFGVYSLFGEPKWHKSASHMNEYLIGLDLKTIPITSTLSFNPDDIVIVRALIRLRQYPGFNKWLYYIGYTLNTANRLLFELHIPSHIKFGINNNNQLYYIEARVNSVDTPAILEDSRGWYTGYTIELNLGLRTKLYKPIYLGLLTGLRKEDADYTTSKGEITESYSSTFTPWFKVSIESWF